MSAPVDVRAVLNYLASHDWDGDARPGNAAVDAAIASVAELIAALKHARSTLATALRHAAPDLFESDEDVNEHLAIKRIDAALARAQGGSA